jgi:hypothetical protein
MNYPPNIGEFKKPPLSERIKVLLAVALVFGCVVGFAATHDRQWQARFATGMGLFLITAIYFPVKSMGDVGMNEEEEDHDKK